MKKFTIGFNTKAYEEPKITMPVYPHLETCDPRKSLVKVYFPSRGVSFTYYNKDFDLKVGDLVYVEGQFEGYRGQVTEVSYSFKIKLSDYKKVIAVIDTNVMGDLYLACTHMVSFEKTSIPFRKVLSWFKAPDEEEYVSGDDASKSFPLDNLSKMNISPEIAERGHDYYMENRVLYIEIDKTHGHAIVEGSENYEIEFNYANGEISNLKCSCFCSGACKHEFAVLLQLRDTLAFICENYENEYDDYFAVINKSVFLNTVLNKNKPGKITMGI